MRKIYTIKMRVIEHYFLLIACLGWVIVYGSMEFDGFFFYRISKGGLLELILVIFIIFGPPAITLLTERFCFGREEFHTIIDEKGYQSYLFRKKYCYVDKGKNIYYAFYHFSPCKMNFIAFSNEPFKICEYIYLSKKTIAIPYISTYDCRKVILLPYNEKTRMEFDIENWKEVESIVGQYNWKTKTVEVRKEEEDC